MASQYPLQSLLTTQSDFISAQNAGRTYSVGSGVQAVGILNYLQVRLSNPAGSGRNLILTDRVFTNNRTATASPLETEFFVGQPTFSGTSVTPNNLNPGGGASVAEFEYRVSTSALASPILSRILPLNGLQDDITVRRTLMPGESIAYQIADAGLVALISAARASISFVWIEEDE